VRWLRGLRPTLLDRYIVREVLPPTGLGLLLFTFILLINEITRLTGILIARGADFPTVIRIFVNLLPSIFAMTVPMAFLLGVLLAFGRLASDSEIVALRASGVSPVRLLRPVVALSLLAGLATFYILAKAVPDANQAYRQLYYSVLVSNARTGVKPRVFKDDILLGGQMVVYVSDVASGTGEWRNLFIFDARDPAQRKVILARTGGLAIHEERKNVELHLEGGVIHAFELHRPEVYEQQRFVSGDFPLPFEQIFPALPVGKGDREMTLPELREQIDELEGQGKRQDAARYWVEFHKKFAIPFACVVFGLLGLGLSLGSKKEARSAAFALSIAVIFVYYVFIRLGEQAGDTGLMPPLLAMWSANLVLGAAAVVLLFLNHREAAFDPLDPALYLAWIPRLRRRSGAPAANRSDVAPRPRPRPVVVIRVPRLSIRFPGILDRYIARRHLGHLALVLAGFTAIFILVHFMDLFDDVQHNRVKGAVVFHYYAFFTPRVVQEMMSVAVLVATLTTFGILSRRNEMTAMKAGGISVYRASLPAVLIGLLGSLLLFTMGEYLLPYTNRVANRDFNVIKGRPPQTSSYLERRWILGSDGRIYNYDYLGEGDASDPGATPEARARGAFSLYGLSVFEVDQETWRLNERLYAARASWNGVAYDLERGWRRRFGPEPSFQAFDQARTREIEPPGYFRREEKESETLRFGELAAQIAALEARGLDVAKLKGQLHKKLAFPMVAMVMTLIAIPFSFAVGRRGALYGIGLSILLAIVYYTAIAVFEALGNNALLPPALAAWAPNLLFAAAGLYLMLRLPT
jgi:LPS export ABC transporter permease LptG/LPS export ABC transporter permease LptF